MRVRSWHFPAAALIVSLTAFAANGQNDSVKLAETFSSGQTFHVRTKVELSGTLTPPATPKDKAPKDKTPKAVKLKGTSLIEYDERILDVEKDAVSKTVRVYKKLDFKRALAGQDQELTLRPAVRRLVVIRQGHTEVPFSPDGPLTWGEIDAVRVDVFTPALAGLLPAKAVRVGDSWDAADSAAQEITDLEKVEDGKLECKLERFVTSGKRRLAKVTFTGTVKGVGEDGPVKHRLNGYYHFDLDGKYLADLALSGVTTLLDGKDKEVGRIEGSFALTREPGGKTGELTESSLRGVKTEPDAENTLLLYDNKQLGLKFLHSRRWRIGRVSGLQVTLDARDGNGLVITLDPPGKSPSAKDFLEESRAFLKKQKAKEIKVYTPARLRNDPPLDAFAIESEMGDQKLWMDYYVTAQANGGATVAARLLPADRTASRKEVDRIARSLSITKKVVEKR